MSYIKVPSHYTVSELLRGYHWMVLYRYNSEFCVAFGCNNGPCMTIDTWPIGGKPFQLVLPNWVPIPC